MITKPTVFVLGAGASIEYGFPSGWGLVQRICAASEDKEVCALLEKLDPGRLDIKHFASSLRKSAKLSVDAFLEHQGPTMLDIGKFMIAAALVPCENEDNLFATGGSPGWYRLLFEKMNCSFERFSQNQVRFITYNYDRSLEHFLTNALAKSYGKSLSQAYAAMRKIQIVHVHGCLGNYEVEQREGRAYLPELEVYAVREAARGIKIVHEDMQNTQELKDAREALGWAKQIFFVGFGYDCINIARLEPQSWVKPEKVISGTTYGLNRDRRNKAIRALMVGKRDVDISPALGNDQRRHMAVGEYHRLRLENNSVDAASFISELPLS